ncbi:discoidin domain-containing protein [Kribbella sp. NPDC005582]|uniref:discoidin domain-containing protein n=1 Tax=Kribbella sp. NPDC005582 TaxID=3156893 RepID=UPI0033B20CB5
MSSTNYRRRRRFGAAAVVCGLLSTAVVTLQIQASPAAVAAGIPDLSSANRRAPIAGLPDWSKAGYRGGAPLPGPADINPDATCQVTASELATQYGVRADGSDATAGLQAAIDAVRTQCTPSAGYNKLSQIALPEGRITVTRQLGLDASYLLLKGAGEGRTVLVFRPDVNTRYDKLTTDGGDWDEDGMTYGSSGKGGWMWPGRGLLRVQTREVAPRYAADYAAAPLNRKDIFEGSINQHWASGIPLREGSAIGTTQIKLATNANMTLFQPGSYLWVGAANTAKFYQQQTVTDTSKYQNLHMRQQIFQITAVDAAGRNLTIDKPLEYDLPLNSTSDGSAAIGGTVYPSRVTPLKPIVGVGIEDLSITQDMTNMPKLAGGTYNLDKADAVHNYGNMAPEYQMHGIVLKWAVNSWVRRVGTEMTGSHPIVTESAKNIQVQESHLDGSWNKGKGGNGYLRGSRVWDSLYAYNTTRNLRHFTFQWSASDNVAIGNDFDSDLNVHGGWERRNLFENNKVKVPFEHSSKNCRSNCGDEGGDVPDDSTWWPIWWAAGPKAVKWSGSSGPQNVVYNNDLSKQTTAGGAYQSFYPDRQRLYQFGSSSADATKFQHLAVNGVPIPDWASRETADYTLPNGGVNASRTDASGSLFLRTPDSGSNDTTAPSTPSSLRVTATTSSSATLAWNASTDNVGVTRYDVLRNGAVAGTSTGTTYTDTGLTAATTYTYTVRAVDAAGNQSAASNTASATTQPGGGGSETLLSRGKTATASSTEGAGFEAGKAVDGNATTRWASKEGVDPQWIRVDLGAAANLTRVKLNWEAAYGKAYQVQLSTDGSTWSTAYSTTTADGGVDEIPVTGTARYVRINGTARGTAYGYSLFEFEVYGTSGGGSGGGGGTAVDVSTAAQLQAALTNAQPGQTIRLAAGQYHGSFVTQRAGSASAPITLTGPASAVLINDGPTGDAPSCPAPTAGWDSGYGLWLFGAPYWKLTGFTVQDSKKGIVLDNSHHVTIDGVSVHQTDEEGVHFRRSSADGVIKNSKVTDAGLVQKGYGEGVYIGSAGSNWGCHGNSGGVDKSDRVQVLDNQLGPNIAAEPIDVKEGTTGGIIRGNTFNGTGISGENSADSWVDVKGIGYLIENNTGTFSSPGVFANGYETHNPSTTPSFPNGCGNIWRNNASNLGGAGQYAINISSASKCSADPNVVYSSNTVQNAQTGLTNIPVTP